MAESESGWQLRIITESDILEALEEQKSKSPGCLMADRAILKHWQDSGGRLGASRLAVGTRVGYQGFCLSLKIKSSPQILIKVQARFYFICC